MLSEIWAEKHKPYGLDGIAGQGKAVEDVLAWLGSRKKGKAALLCGPAGSGKTLLVETLARREGLELMQLNASDKRNAEEIESFAQTTRTRPLFSKGKIILLDEVDGISGQDRGAVTAIIKLIEGSSFPVFLIANDPWNAKLRPLRSYATIIKFHKVPIPSIAKRLKEICDAEGIKPEEDALKHLARWAQGDMRSAINDLQMVSHGKSQLGLNDLEILGFRERESSVFEILPTIFKSRNLVASRKAINNADRDADEIFWWLENNMHLEFNEPGELAAAFETLARADMFRSLVVNQQNWRFKGFMVDMMSGISLAKTGHEYGEGHHGFTPYQPPSRFADMARARRRREELGAVCSKIGAIVHASQTAVIKDYLPYFRIIMKKQKAFAESIGLEKEDVKAIK